MTINYKEELTNALEDKENKNKQEIVRVIFQNIPKTKELNVFKFICEAPLTLEFTCFQKEFEYIQYFM